MKYVKETETKLSLNPQYFQARAELINPIHFQAWAKLSSDIQVNCETKPSQAQIYIFLPVQAKSAQLEPAWAEASYWYSGMGTLFVKIGKKEIQLAK